MIRKLIASFVLVALVQPAEAVQLRRVVTDSGIVLRLRGHVTAGDYRRLKSAFQNGSVVGLDIRSDGGSLEAGLDIAHVVRERGLAVYASKKCNSVCAFILFAAKERYIGRRGKIGVHSVSNDRGKEDGDSVRVTVQVSRLLVRLGVPHSIIGKIVATPPAKITYLDNRDLAELNVHRTNPFRNIYEVASTTHQVANSVCNAAVDIEIDATAHAGDTSCTQARARVQVTQERRKFSPLQTAKQRR
jgi:hypothetical protein